MYFRISFHLLDLSILSVSSYSSFYRYDIAFGMVPDNSVSSTCALHWRTSAPPLPAEWASMSNIFRMPLAPV
jgi:hypothetical protein